MPDAVPHYLEDMCLVMLLQPPVETADLVRNKLSAFDGDVHAAFLLDWPQEAKDAASSEQIERVGHFAYRGRGLVIDKLAGLVQVHGFNIDFGNVPFDGYVEFEIGRLGLG